MIYWSLWPSSSILLSETSESSSLFPVLCKNKTHTLWIIFIHLIQNPRVQIPQCYLRNKHFGCWGFDLGISPYLVKMFKVNDRIRIVKFYHHYPPMQWIKMKNPQASSVVNWSVEFNARNRQLTENHKELQGFLLWTIDFFQVDLLIEIAIVPKFTRTIKAVSFFISLQYQINLSTYSNFRLLSALPALFGLDFHIGIDFKRNSFDLEEILIFLLLNRLLKCEF